MQIIALVFAVLCLVIATTSASQAAPLPKNNRGKSFLQASTTEAPPYDNPQQSEMAPIITEAAPGTAQCSKWNTDTTMYNCETVPKCCTGFEAKGISTDTVQCVEKSLGDDYAVMCSKASTTEAPIFDPQMSDDRGSYMASTTTMAPIITEAAAAPAPSEAAAAPSSEEPSEELTAAFEECDEQSRFDIMMCKSHMCTKCTLAYCMESCQSVQKDFPTCRCDTWPKSRASFSGGDFAGKGKVGDAGDYSK